MGRTVRHSQEIPRSLGIMGWTSPPLGEGVRFVCEATVLTEEGEIHERD